MKMGSTPLAPRSQAPNKREKTTGNNRGPYDLGFGFRVSGLGFRVLSFELKESWGAAEKIWCAA